jgi:hypothetical protein
MNVSATKLVYVNRGSAKIKNDDTGEFVNETPNGVIVRPGDLLSVEGIAVESRGVGTTIIEVPQRVKDYKYLTNKSILNCWYYINHNFEYTVLNPIDQLVIYGSKTADNFGYLSTLGGDGNTYFTPNRNADYQSKTTEFNKLFAGKPFYIGMFDFDPNNPTVSSTPAEADLITPSRRVFNFIEANLELAVDFGYDSPANISSKITGDLHKGRFSPNPTILTQTGYTVTVQDKQPNALIVNNQKFVLDVVGATGSNDEVVITIPVLPYAYQNSLPGGKNYSMYNSLQGVLNPLYYYWGSRLLADQAYDPEGTVKNIYFMKTYVNGGVVNHRGSIFNIATVRPNRTIRGDLLILNLNYDVETLQKLRSLIHSQKSWTAPFKANTEDLSRPINKKYYEYAIPVGRYLDQAEDDPYLFSERLQSPLLGEGQSSVPTYLQTMAFYNKQFYEDSGAIYDDGTVMGRLILETDYKVDYKGETINPKSLSQILDINVFCVSTPAENPNSREYCIAIPLLEGQSPDTIGVLAGNYMLVDFTKSRIEATQVQIVGGAINSNTDNDPNAFAIYSRQQKTISIGAPEMQLRFDDQRGRFSFTDLYWRNYIGNSWTAGQSSIPVNPDPEQEVVTVGKYNIFPWKNDASAIPDPVYGVNAEGFVVYTKYAQSGIGIYNVSVLDEGDNVYPIDTNDSADIEAKFNNSLLSRLGFEYNKFINTYGKAEVFFQEQYYNTQIKTKYPTYFPYPLTNNPLIDSTFNQYLSVNDYNAPTFTLDTQRDIPNINIASSTSYIYATKLPQKLATPYWLIQSDIIDGIKFQKDGQTQNIMAICNRSYISGDFAFSFATDYKFKADKPFVISGIKTRVLTSDLLPADIDDGTTVIYKIESQYLEEQEREQESIAKSK